MSSQGMNPYGVGRSRAKADLRTGKCKCCDIEFEDSGPQPMYLDRCLGCQDHNSRTTSDEIAMLKDHANRYLEIQKRARLFAHGQVEERKAMEERMVSALRSRDRWRTILSAIEEVHAPLNEDEDLCACGDGDCDIPQLLEAGHKNADQEERRRESDYHLTGWRSERQRQRDLDERLRRTRAKR